MVQITFSYIPRDRFSPEIRPRVNAWCRIILPITLVLLCVLPAAAQSVEPSIYPPPEKKRVLLAITETLLVNVVVNLTNSYAFGEKWSRVHLDDWKRNWRFGWEWDDNPFGTNMFAHPYHGSAYFNAGRSNGLSFWESAPLVYLGSWTWEFFAETYRPSFNDFFMTSFGGITLGEVTHRLSAMIRDEQTRGAERIAREFVAGVMNPVSGVNRLFRGQWTRVGPNPPEHDPDAYYFAVGAGVRNVYEDSTGIENFAPTILLDLQLGDPFGRGYSEPFDVFALNMQISPGGGNLNVLQAFGRLYQTGLSDWGANVRHDFVVNLRYDYLNTIVYQFGGQSVEAGIISRFPLPEGFFLRTRASGDFLIMGGISAPFSGVRNRSYDFGPGGGATIAAEIERGGNVFFSAYTRVEYLHSVSGAPADHVITFSGIKGNVLLFSGLGVGFFMSADTRTSFYPEFGEINRKFFETRVFISWSNSRRPFKAGRS